MTHLTEGVEYRVEIHKDFTLGDLGDVVETFGGEVSHPVLWIGETYEQRVDKLFHIRRNVNPQRDSGPGQSNKPSITHVKRISGVAEHIHELVHDLVDSALVPLLMTLAYLPTQGL